jgi:hypothetical protein
MIALPISYRHVLCNELSLQLVRLHNCTRGATPEVPLVLKKPEMEGMVTVSRHDVWHEVSIKLRCRGLECNVPAIGLKIVGGTAIRNIHYTLDEHNCTQRLGFSSVSCWIFIRPQGLFQTHFSLYLLPVSDDLDLFNVDFVSIVHNASVPVQGL